MAPTHWLIYRVIIKIVLMNLGGNINKNTKFALSPYRAMTDTVKGISGEKATVGRFDELTTFLEGEEFSRVLGMYRMQEKRSKILNAIKASKKSFILNRIAKGHFNSIRNLFVQEGPRLPCEIKKKIQSGHFRQVELLFVMRRIKDVALKIRHAKAKPQGGWDPLGTKALAGSVREVAEEAKKLQSKFEDKSQTFVDLGQSMKRSLDEALHSLVPALTKTAGVAENLSQKGLTFNIDFLSSMLADPMQATIALAVVYIFLEYLDHTYDIEQMHYVKVLVASVAIFKCGSAMKEMFLKWLSAKISTTPQAGWTDWISITCQGIMFAVFGATVDTSTLSKAVKSLAEASSNATKLQDVFTSILDWFKHVGTLIVNFFGFETFSWLQTHDLVLSRFITKVNELNAAFVENPMCVNIGFVQEVTKLIMEVNDYSSTVSIKSKNTPVLVAIKQIQDKLMKLQNAIAGAGLTLGERSEPGIRVLASAAGVGKTYWTEFEQQHIVMAFAETAEEIVDATRDWRAEVYPWPMENKHHDQYRGQRIINYPDLFCQTDAEGQPGEPASLVFLVGDQIMSLPAADIIKKQKLLVISDVITANTNVVMIHRGMFKSVRNPEAVTRRCNECSFYMYVTDKYALKNPDGSYNIDPASQKVRGYEHHDYLYARIDKKKVPKGVLPDDVYRFRRHNFATGSFMDNKIYDQKGYLHYVIDYILEKKAAGQTKKHLLKEQMESLAKKRLQELSEPRPQADEIECEVDPDFKPLPVEELDEYDLKSLDVRRIEKEKMSHLLLENKYKVMKELQVMEDELSRQAFLDSLVEDMEEEMAGYETADEGKKGKSQMDPNGRNIESNFDDFLTRLADDFANLEGDGTVSENIQEMPVVSTDRQKNLMDRFSEDIDDLKGRPQFDYKSYWKPEITQLQYDIIKDQVDILYTELAEAHKIIDGKLGKSTPLRNLEETAAMMSFVYTLRDMPEVSEISQKLSITHLLQFKDLSYDDVCLEIRGWFISYKFKNPLMRAINQTKNFMEDIWFNMRTFVPVMKHQLKHALAPWVPRFIKRFWYSERFLICVDTAIATFVTMAGMTIFGMLATWIHGLFATRKKKKTKNQSAEEEIPEIVSGLRAVNQGSWAAGEGVQGTITKHLDNFACLYVVIHHGGKTYTRHPCNLTFLGSNLALTVRHITEGIAKLREVVADSAGTKIELVVVPFIGNTLNKSTERAFVNDVKFEGNPEMDLYDLSIIRFDAKGFRNRAKITHLIPPVKCMEYLMKQSRLEGIFVERTIESDLTFTGRENRVPVVFDFGKTITYDTSIDHDGKTYELSSYKYPSLMMTGKYESFETEDGYCASPGFLVDPRKNACTRMEWPQAQQAWLCYLHTSIQGRIPNGVPLFREMFEEWIKELSPVTIKPPVEEIKENVEFYEKTFAEEMGLKTTPESDDFEIVSEFEKLDINHTSVASTNLKFNEPYRTSIERSPLHGIDPRTRVPTRFGTVKTPEGPVNVLEKSRAPCGMNNICVNGPLVDAIMYQAMGRIHSDSSVPKHRVLLDFDQCLYGDPAYNLSSMNWQSSGGFYLKVLKDYFKTDWKAKSWMLGPDQKLIPEVYRAVEKVFNHFDEKLINGERIYSLAVDNIKDELLPKEKVLEGKGRLFCVYDLTFLLLSKKYFGAMSGWIYENRIRNGMAIGVNPYSTDWDAIATKILMNSSKCIFLDHTQFDKNQIRRIMHCLNILADIYYNDAGSLNSKVRRLLLEEVIDSIHVTMINGKMYVYYWGQGNTSGNYFTALLNCCVNIVYVYICAIYAWLLFNGIDPNSITVLPSNPADKALAIVDLGDDVVASVNDELMPGVNFNTIKAVGKKYLNITITDELKKGGDIPDFRNLEEGSFLGRKFVLVYFNGVRRYIAPLRLYSVIERVQWIKGIYDPTIEVEKMESTFLELSLHDKETFYYYVLRYAVACQEAYGKYPRFTNYEIARNYILNMANDKYSFSDFLESDGEYAGPDLLKLLISLREEEVRGSCVVDFTKDSETLVAITSFSGNAATIVDNAGEVTSLRRIPQGSGVSFVTDDMSMDIETEGVVDTTAPLWL